MPIHIKPGETNAERKRIYFHCVDATDGLTAETGEASGQPQISTNGAAFTNTGIGTLVAIGNGRYYAVLTDGTVDTTGRVIESRYKSAATAEAVGTTIQVGGEVDLVDAPSSTAVTAVQLGIVQDDQWTDARAGYLDNISAGAVAVAGDEMDLIDAPNATAVTAIQSGLAQTGADSDTLETISDQLDGVALDDQWTDTRAGYLDNLSAGAPAVAGDEMDLIDAPNATAVTAIQNGLATTGADSDTLETLSDQLDGKAATGAEMDLVDAPNATAITAIQSGLSTLSAGEAMALTADAVDATSVEDFADFKATGFAVAGDEMDLIDAPNATAVTAIQSGLSTLSAGAEMDLVDAPNSTAVTAIQSGLSTHSASEVWDVDLVGKETTASDGTDAGEMLAASRAGIAGKLVISGTTVTLYEVDGTTAIWTATLDDADTPTSRTAPA